MVQLNTIIYWLVAGLAIPCSCVSVGDITSEIDDIASKITALGNLWGTIPANGPVMLTDAANLMSSGQAVTALMSQTTNNLRSISAAQLAPAASGILSQLQGIEPHIVSFLNTAVVKKPALSSLPASTKIISTLLTSFNMSTSSFEKAFLSKAPGNIVSVGQNLQKDMDSAFSNAMQAYMS